MKAMAQGFPYEFSKAKKVVASVVAAALVISFGNFALGGGKAIADDGTVEVRFNITAPGATVTLSTGEKFTAESDDNLYQAPTDADLSFTAVSDDGAELKVTHDAPEPVEPQVQTMGSKQPSGITLLSESRPLGTALKTIPMQTRKPRPNPRLRLLARKMPPSS